MTVRRNSVQTRSETGTRRPGTGSAVCGSACPAPQAGTGTKRKGASLQQYVEGLNGETARHSHVSSLATETFMNSAG
jgi:hypothetical protein